MLFSPQFVARSRFAPGSGSGGGPAGSAVSYIARSDGNANLTYTYTSAPIASGASDIIVVGVVGENSSVAASVSGVTVGGNALTEYTPGNIRNDFIVVGFTSIFYGVPGAFATADIVATCVGANTKVCLMVWKLSGQNATPLSQLSSASANSTTMVISNIHTSVGGAVIGIYGGQPHKTITETWSGSGSFVEDSDAVDPTGNEDATGGSVATSASSTTESLTFTASAAAQHCGGVISFGP